MGKRTVSSFTTRRHRKHLSKVIWSTFCEIIQKTVLNLLILGVISDCRGNDDKSGGIMADKPTKTASLLVPTSEETRGSFQVFLNGNTEVHAERGANFIRVAQLAALHFLSTCWREKATVISETWSVRLLLQSVLNGPLNGQNRQWITTFSNYQESFFLVFGERAVHVCVEKQLLPEPTMREVWENIPKIQTELNMML